MRHPERLHHRRRRARLFRPVNLLLWSASASSSIVLHLTPLRLLPALEAAVAGMGSGSRVRRLVGSFLLKRAGQAVTSPTRRRPSKPLVRRVLLLTSHYNLLLIGQEMLRRLFCLDQNKDLPISYPSKFARGVRFIWHKRKIASISGSYHSL